MPYTAAVTIYTEANSANREWPRPAGTIMAVNLPARKGGFGPDTPYGLLDVTGIPDRLTIDDLQVRLTQDWRNISDDEIIQLRDIEVVYADLPAPVRASLNNRRIKRATISLSDFLAATLIKRHTRRLLESDL